MGAPKGNKYSPGRGTAIKEQKRLEELWKKWSKPGEANKILRRVGSGKESLQDVFFALGYKENERILTAIFKKLYPDMVEQKGDISGELKVTWQSKK